MRPPGQALRRLRPPRERRPLSPGRFQVESQRAPPLQRNLEESGRGAAHVFLCMLAYYVEGHMRQALAPLLFHDEELDRDRARRDPVAPAQPSESVRRTLAMTTYPSCSLQTLLADRIPDSNGSFDPVPA